MRFLGAAGTLKIGFKPEPEERQGVVPFSVMCEAVPQQADELAVSCAACRTISCAGTRWLAGRR